METLRAFLAGILAGLLVAVQMLWGPQPVSANFGGPQDAGRACDATIQSQCVAEDWIHTINYSSTLDSRYVPSADYAGALWDNGITGHLTDMVLFWDVPYHANNDLRISDTSAYGNNGFYAWTRCISNPTATGDLGTSRDGEDMKWCKPQYFFWNNYYTDLGIHTTNELKAISCHEVGHSMGLRHRSQTSGTSSCMRSTPTQDSGVSPQGPLMQPEVHEIDYHLNYEY